MHLIDFHSTEKDIITDVLSSYPMMDLVYIPLIIENMMYSRVTSIEPPYKLEYTKRYNQIHGEYKETLLHTGDLITLATYELGVLSGEYKYWHLGTNVDGERQLHDHVHFDDGKFHGSYKSWYSTGQLYMEATFDHGVNCGKNIRYHPNGRIWVEMYYNQGIKYGLHREWNEDGTLTFQTDYENKKTA